MAGLQKKIYDSLPYPFKVFLLNIKAYLNVKQRYNKEFNSYLSHYSNLWKAPLSNVLQYQKKELTQLLLEIFEHSDWYRVKMEQLNITTESIRKDPFKVLVQMPILEKIDRKKNVLSLSNKNRKTAMVHYTSGTSGTPTVDYIDKESINKSFALWKRFHKVIGITKKNKTVRFSGRLIINANTKKPPFWVYNYFEKQLLMSTYHLTSNNLPHYLKKLNNFKPELLDGYPSALYILSRFINKKSIKLDFTPLAIAVTAETLYDYQRHEIEKAFGCKVFNQYASNEGSPLITECIAGHLHLNLDSGVFEFLNPKGEKAKPGELAYLVVSSFINFKTPLVRYNIGDTVELSDKDEKCSCGCEMPIIKKIIGREDDILWTEEKGYVGRMDTAYKGLSGIAKSQIIQESPSKISINMVVEEEFNDDVKEKLFKNIKERLGQNIECQINIVNDIPAGVNGKFDAVKRNFDIQL